MRALLIVVTLLVALSGALFIMDRGPLVIVQEGEYQFAVFLGYSTVHTEPGVGITYPGAQIHRFDARRQPLRSGATNDAVPTADQERIIVDHYAVWRITDPERFYQGFGVDAEEAEHQINQDIGDLIRSVVGQRTLAQVLSDDREGILQEITRRSAGAVERFGVELLDVRINRTDLPPAAESNVYARMRSERERLASKHRAEGEEEARRLRADADREAQIVVAEARRASEIARGEGDARAAAVYAEAYGADPEFYEFVRSLEAYRKTIGTGTTMILPPDHPFFRILQSDGKAPGR
jgi:membrane protease subunit HflC